MSDSVKGKGRTVVYIKGHISGTDPEGPNYCNAKGPLFNSFQVEYPFSTLACCYLLLNKPSWTNTTILMMLMSERHKAKKTLPQFNSGRRLEEWTKLRNTKSQYTKQLCNFLKVSTLSYFTFKQHILI